MLATDMKRELFGWIFVLIDLIVILGSINLFVKEIWLRTELL